MKKLFYSLAVLCFACTACSSDHDDHVTPEVADIETRATTLGFKDVDSYVAYTNEQCLLGNHQNCDINPDGTHVVCCYHEHAGTKHDGSHHNGKDHGVHDGNGGHHHNGNGHGGDHHNE